ncbi:hypothetical protein [Flavobacterium aquiphilum]|uniref:hypothetical protein n=1 Tax=Flavobacterium aquiphilum TaxID=3003261 RepID=UPI00247FA24B|nr:hypothetical protein [Flavobacterium aquiphilum]
MKVTDLRIGNLFIDKYSKKIIPVLELLRNGNIIFDIEYFGIWQAEPIPLTENWIEKLKFDHNHWATKWILYDMPTPTGIKYVHQLQNLYFALTGEELTINN